MSESIQTSPHEILKDIKTQSQGLDQKSKRHILQEWFVAPLGIVGEELNLINSGEIVNSKYNFELGTIDLKH